jgi:hypothetical protein
MPLYLVQFQCVGETGLRLCLTTLTHHIVVLIDKLLLLYWLVVIIPHLHKGLRYCIACIGQTSLTWPGNLIQESFKDS